MFLGTAKPAFSHNCDNGFFNAQLKTVSISRQLNALRLLPRFGKANSAWLASGMAEWQKVMLKKGLPACFAANFKG